MWKHLKSRRKIVGNVGAEHNKMHHQCSFWYWLVSEDWSPQRDLLFFGIRQGFFFSPEILAFSLPWYLQNYYVILASLQYKYLLWGRSAWPEQDMEWILGSGMKPKWDFICHSSATEEVVAICEFHADVRSDRQTWPSHHVRCWSEGTYSTQDWIRLKVFWEEMGISLLKRDLLWKGWKKRPQLQLCYVS